MALGGRQTQLNNLMHRFLGVPLNDTDDPDNIFRLLRTHIGASSPRDILRLTREDLDDFELIDAIGDDKELTYIQKLRILWFGPTDRIGDALTYWILTNDTKECVARSNVRPAKDDMFPNRLAKPPDKPIIRSVQDEFDEPISLPHFSPDELLGLTFLREIREGDDKQLIRATVESKVMDRDKDTHQNIMFLLKIGDEEAREIMTLDLSSVRCPPTLS